MGLIVNLPNIEFSITNNGNFTRYLFKFPYSALTGRNKKLIKRFNDLLKSISSGYDINLEVFDQYS